MTCLGNNLGTGTLSIILKMVSMKRVITVGIGWVLLAGLVAI